MGFKSASCSQQQPPPPYKPHTGADRELQAEVLLGSSWVTRGTRGQPVTAGAACIASRAAWLLGLEGFFVNSLANVQFIHSSDGRAVHCTCVPTASRDRKSVV